METLNISWELAGKLVGKSPDELKKALTEGEEGEVKFIDNHSDQFNTLVLDKFKSAERSKVESEVGRALKTRMKDLESSATPIFEKFGVELAGDSFKDSLIKLSEKVKEVTLANGEGGEELTEEVIKSSPIYQSLLDSNISELQNALEEVKTEYSDYKTAIQNKELSTLRKSSIHSVLEGANAVWGSDKPQQLERFIRGLDPNFSINFDNDNKPVLVNAKDNSVAKDKYHNPINFNDWVLGEWSSAGYALHSAPPNNDSNDPPSNNHQQHQQNKFTVKITSQQDYEQLLEKYSTDPAKKSVIRRAYAEFLKSKAHS